MRFIIANRLAGKGSRKAKRAAGDRAEMSLMASTNVMRDNKPDAEEARRVFVVEADAHDLPKIAKDFDPDVMVEPELPRHSAECSCPMVDEAVEAQGAHPMFAGIGETLSFTVTADGAGVVGAKVMVIFAAADGVGPGTRHEAATDGDGKVETSYDAARYRPAMVAIEPRSCYWSALAPAPADGGVIALERLPKTGPDAWWRQLLGQYGDDTVSGEGIRIGIIDTGLGPHPYLKHITGLGAITDEGDRMNAKATADLRGHGTHVAGLIGARPVAGSGDYLGVAPGADIAALRVFEATGGAHQGDIASAIDAMALDFKADIINLSLGAAEPSQIERDAVIAALEQGALSIASAGNNRGAPVLYPAAYPETIAVSALGILGAAAPNTLAAASAPSSPAAYVPAPGGIFSANFSNAGVELTCAAPGVGIISTVPARPEVPAPYGVKNGTSMAAPLTTAALATVLSQDAYYKDLPRDMSRPSHAAQVLFAMLRPLGLPQALAGYGLTTALTHPPEGPTA